MKKRILSMLLATLMVVSMLPTTAFAADPIGSWGDLQAAINAAATGDTIQLTQDLSAADGDSALKIDKKLTLDLNGYMLDAKSNISSIICLADGADLTITDSANLSAGAHDIYSCNGEI